jgi:hypothetical protein
MYSTFSWNSYGIHFDRGQFCQVLPQLTLPRAQTGVALDVRGAVPTVCVARLGGRGVAGVTLAQNCPPGLEPGPAGALLCDLGQVTSSL